MFTLQEVLLLVFAFASLLFAFVWAVHRKHGTHSGTFLNANRNVSVFQGAMSIAAAWIWAPAVFICSQKAYEQGIAGAFWFIVPNIICFFVFAPFAVKLRKNFPHGFSFPDFLYDRYKNARLHLASLFVYFGYQLGAIIINTVAGGFLLNTLTGIPYELAVVLIFGVALSYSLISGLKASVLTDVIQMMLILFIGFIIVPWLIHDLGGFSPILNNIGGVTGKFSNPFDATIAYSFGIVASISLISGPFADQMFYQRTFAVKENVVLKTFIWGGLIFGVVPTILCLLGFVGASSPEVIALINENPERNAQMVGPLTIAQFLPKGALMAFLVLAFSALCSTLDSALNGVSSLFTVDVYKRYLNPQATNEQLLKTGRMAMLCVGVISIAIALLQPKLLWLFLIYGTLASAAFFPAILSVYWKRLTADAAFWAIVSSLVLGMPLSIYANTRENVSLTILATVLSLGISFAACVFISILSGWKIKKMA